VLFAGNKRHTQMKKHIYVVLYDDKVVTREVFRHEGVKVTVVRTVRRK
jgi:hypothetical protein